MRNLQREVVAFQKFLAEAAIPEFSELSKDIYDHNHNIIFDSLTHYGQEMRLAVQKNQDRSFDWAKDQYLKLFTYANTEIAKDFFLEYKDHYIEEGLSEVEAEAGAMDSLWNQSEKYKEWLPGYMLLSNGSEQVEVVARKKHSSGTRPFVTTQEIQELKNNPQINPWDRARSNYEETFPRSTINS